jgi:molybdopterin converting factor subunit 1
MKVRVLYFSVLRDATGMEEQTVVMPPSATVASLLAALYVQHPKLQAWDSALLTAVDHTYVKRHHPLADGAEVAVMPPVQGG